MAVLKLAVSISFYIIDLIHGIILLIHLQFEFRISEIQHAESDR